MKIPGWVVVPFIVGGQEGHTCAAAGSKLNLEVSDYQVPEAHPRRHSSRQRRAQYLISI